MLVSALVRACPILVLRYGGFLQAAEKSALADWLQFAIQCFCGNAAPGAGSTLATNGDTACLASQCSGDVTEFCGGGNRLLVYKRNP